MSSSGGGPGDNGQSQGAGPLHSSPGYTADDIAHLSKEIGWLGNVFGAKEHAPINISGMIILLCIVGILISEYITPASGMSASDIVKLLSGIALAALTFLGGYLGGRGR